MTAALPVPFKSFLQFIWDIAVDAITNFRNNGQTNQAAAISLYAILSLIPFLILTFLVAGYVFGAHPEIKIQLTKGLQFLSPTVASALSDQLNVLEEKERVFGGLGLITLLWFSSMVFGSVETAFNMVFPNGGSRSYITSKALAVSMIPLAWVLGMMSFVLTALPGLLGTLTHQSSSSLLKSNWLRLVIPYTITVFFSAFLYKIIPRVKIPWALSLAVALVFATLVEPTKYLFPWYVTHYAKYNIIYGSLGTLTILIFWIFYISIIFLFCAEMMASYLRRDLILLEKMFSRKSKNTAILDERVVKRFGRFFPKGTYIFFEGDLGKEMYYIINGRVRMEKTKESVRKILGEMEAGQYFGEMAALIDAPRSASAYTLNDSTLAVIDRQTFSELLKRSESVSLLMLQEFSRRLKSTTESLEREARTTLVLYLLLYLICRGRNGVSSTTITSDIASLTGREEREVEIIITDLIARGMIRREGDLLLPSTSDLMHHLMHNQKMGHD
ncbi:MAG: YihY family inner membrane protein [Syntrophales bacterium]|nr:YihY family inner membrane protein [Syntrophales bacterium]